MSSPFDRYNYGTTGVIGDSTSQSVCLRRLAFIPLFFLGKTQSSRPAFKDAGAILFLHMRAAAACRNSTATVGNSWVFQTRSCASISFLSAVIMSYYARFAAWKNRRLSRSRAKQRSEQPSNSERWLFSAYFIFEGDFFVLDLSEKQRKARYFFRVQCRRWEYQSNRSTLSLLPSHSRARGIRWYFRFLRVKHVKYGFRANSAIVRIQWERPNR